MIFLLYVDQFYLHVSSYLSTCISLLPCRCLSFSSSWHCPHLGGISALLPHLLFWNPLFVPLMSCTSLEMVSLKSRKRRQWSQWPSPPRGAWEPNYVGKSVKQAAQGFTPMLAKSGFLPPREKGDMETHSCLLACVSRLIKRCGHFTRVCKRSNMPGSLEGREENTCVEQLN